ncbi:hypothetical protein SteCoe_23659 [Stentor coeruleus]|uniref:Rab-GAP TBC domain-containing protein n=1 Tax=Stentor coeruleus TaxID=5963 RepID=A0A1R2BJE1_9CILI|nr:hypothetical protein SteCoe_23659 [Stentor coeruleus]
MSTSSELEGPDCKICETNYTSTLPCERCEQEACKLCTVKSKWVYSHPSGKGQYNICSDCYGYINAVERLIHNGCIKWSSITPLGFKWYSVSGCEKWAKTNKICIQDYLDVPIDPADIEQISKDIDTGRSDPRSYNFSMCEALLRVETPSYKEDIKKVLYGYCARNSKVGYCQGMNMVAVWLLMYFDHNLAFLMICFLVEKLLLPDFYIGSKHGNSLNGFYIESTVIASVLEHLMSHMKKSQIPTNEFADFFSMQHLIQIFVSTVDIETTVFMWDRLCHEGSIALIKGVTSLVKVYEKDVKKGLHPLQLIRILNNSRVVIKVKETYEKLSKKITRIRVDRIRQIAKDFRAKQWLDCEKMVVNKLENISSFTHDEILKLQKRFNSLLKELSAPNSPRSTFKRQSTLKLPKSLQSKSTKDESFLEVGISKPQFLRLLSDVAPTLVPKGEEIFNKYDQDASGYLDFRELTIAMSVLSKGTFEEKLQICFDAFDHDNSGYLETEEINQLLEKMLMSYIEKTENHQESNELNEKISKIKAKMNHLCEQSSGKLFFDDFLRGMKADMFLYSCISDFIFTEKPRVSSVIKAMNSNNLAENQTFEYIQSSPCKMCQIF